MSIAWNLEIYSLLPMIQIGHRRVFRSHITYFGSQSTAGKNALSSERVTYFGKHGLGCWCRGGCLMRRDVERCWRGESKRTSSQAEMGGAEDSLLLRTARLHLTSSLLQCREGGGRTLDPRRRRLEKAVPFSSHFSGHSNCFKAEN